MIIPDLQKELAYWVDKLRLGNWKISIRYEADPRDPNTGDPVYGYCRRQTDVPRADIVVRTPTSAADIAETHDTIVHELLHCRLAGEGRMGEENAVWALAPLLTELRLNTPAKAAILCKAIARAAEGRNKTLPGAQVRSRAGEGYYMDPQQLAALALQAGQLLAQEGLPPEMKSILEQLIALAAGGAAPPPAEVEKAPTKDGDKPAEQPEGAPMKAAVKEQPGGAAAKAAFKMDVDATALLKQIQSALSGAGGVENVQLKTVQEQMASDRAAAVDGLLDTRPDLSAKQRARLRELGLAQGVAKVREDLAELIPPPKPAEPAKAETRAKLGEDKPIRGSATLAKAMPSGDKHVDQLFRIINKDPANDGVEIPAENTGVLARFSVVQAYAKIKYNAEQAREQQRAKMGGTR